MKFLLSSVCVIAVSLNCFAQFELQFMSRLIPDSLRKNADAVYRYNRLFIDVKSRSKYTITEERAITMLSKEASEHGTVVLVSDKHIKVDDAEVKVYDSVGREVLKYKKKDFEMIGSPVNDAFVSDTKYYYLTAVLPDFPCTITISATTVINSYVDFPDFYMASYDESFVTSHFKVNVPKELDIRYKAFNTKLKPQIAENGELKTYEWIVNGQTALFKEPNTYAAGSKLPRIAIAPNEFEYDDYKGSFKTWKDYGQWYYNFYEEKKPFTETQIATIKSSVEGFSTTEEKVRFLYKQMQKNTRYVSIQLGIGGLKPFPASFVEEKKYGDCKALTNYMKHVLKAAGITSYPAIIKSGTNAAPADPDFPNEGFDHVILCVPNGKDSIWLECTSKLTPAGIPGNFTENRNALLITENGGVLVNTPRSKATHNQWHSSSFVKLYDDGSAIIDTRVYVTGEFNEKVNYLLTNKSKAELKKIFINSFGLKSPDDFELQPLKDSAAGSIVKIKLAYGRYYDVQAGKKLFFPLRHYRLYENELQDTTTRTTDYQFSFPFIKTDSLTIEIPAGLKTEQIPSNQQIKNDYLNYTHASELKSGGNTLSLTAQLEIKQLQIPATHYKPAALSMLQVRKDAAQKLIFRKE